MSLILKQFFKELQQWIQDGTPEDGRPFREDGGVCANLEYWLGRHHEDTQHVEDVAEEHSNLLEKLYGDSVYPFNSCSLSGFTDEGMLGTHWKNEKRLNYVKQQAAAGEGDE